VELAADVRHRGQGDSVTVALGERLRDDPAAQVEAAFEAAYVALYGRRPGGVEPEVLTWRVRVAAPSPDVVAEGAAGADGAPRVRRPIWSPEAGGMVEADVVARAGLAPGDVVQGPAVVQERESTVVVGVGGTGSVDSCGALVVELP